MDRLPNSNGFWLIAARVLARSYRVGLLSVFCALMLCVSIEGWSSRLVIVSCLRPSAIFLSDRLIILHAAAYMIPSVLVDFGLNRNWRRPLKLLFLFALVVVAAMSLHDVILN